MQTDKLFGNQSFIVTLDVDTYLFERLKHIADAGFAVVEVNTHDQNLLKKILEEFPGLRVGSGNVINTQQLEDCYQAGVHFVSSPGYLAAIAQTAAIYSINYLPGIATISEAMQVISLGYHQARPYPATLSFCTLLNKCLPMLRLFPAEVEWEEAEHYLSLPAVAAVSILNPETKMLDMLSAGVLA
ncbi:beta/alpha barrel domain-containing protein [Legionella spiritensis]|uniref:Keto-hydroxyglutarate aldolase n=1 Tax=Legionella spiritensis TaxID=452 RepID=A0A0W0Z6X2_LEGSP|nr:multidrug DMT transporter permease [Legionella spiritensis]KTD64871.1 keto-hydroxyglutarate aldolase [Legionella spiritensis]SNV41016.1 keto-hydroxyglutarate aldolase [Legionella spiritensis]VEG90514.1 keto-hydroxyglutarate aldolase [Legionella spiritensis]